MNGYEETKGKKESMLVLYLLFFGSVVMVAFGIAGAIWDKNGSVEAVVKQQNVKLVNETTGTVVPKTDEETIEKDQTTPVDLNNPDQLIEYYRSQLETNPDNPDTPAYLFAMGNLYKLKKMDCASAIPYYERIVIEFPNWEGIKSVFPELASCYEAVNDAHGKIWVYEEMMKRFPEDSQEYLFAKKALNLD